jgi:hypothetical protein
MGLIDAANDGLTTSDGHGFSSGPEPECWTPDRFRGRHLTCRGSVSGRSDRNHERNHGRRQESRKPESPADMQGFLVAEAGFEPSPLTRQAASYRIGETRHLA